MPVYNPLTNKQFPGDIIPQSRLDAAAKAFMALEPLSNTIGTLDAVSNRYTNNYVFQESVPYTAPRYSVRLDHAVGPNVRLYGSVNRWIAATQQSLAFHNPILATSYGCNCDQGWQASTGYTQTINPTLVVDARFDFNRWVEERTAASLGIDPKTAVGIQSNPFNEIPSINIGSYSSFGYPRRLLDFFRPKVDL